MRSMRCAATVLFVSVVTATAGAQSFTIESTPFQVNTVFTVSLSQGPANASFIMATDVAPGPVQTSYGPIGLGLTPQLTILPAWFLDAQGGFSVVGAFNNVPAWIGNVVYYQAACLNPAMPNNLEFSNPMARAIHAADPGPGSMAYPDVGDNASVAVSLPFAFQFFGASYTVMNASSNGLISFGGINIGPQESLGEFMDGLPKVAVLWDDLVPPQGAGVTVETGIDYVRVCWNDVPQLWAGDSNTAHATFFANGSITIDYPLVELKDCIVGLGPGGWIGSAEYQLYSQAAEGTTLPNAPLLEHFTVSFNGFDLSGERLTFEPLDAAASSWRWFR